MSLKDIFVPGEAYQWKVKGFDAEGGIAGESLLYRFLFKELSSCLPGEIVVVTRKQGKGSGLAENIGAKYGLRLLEAFDIESLGLSVVIFYTEKEILKLINAIMKEDGVILAQPNYISRTMSEPMSDMQNIYKILNLNMLHKHYRGAGVKVAVIDTGVDTNHRDLKARIVSSENLMQGPYRAEIHGTALAGVIGACINEYGIEGIAPEVEILVLRACKQVSKIRPEGTCYTTSVSKALDSAIENGAKIVNMGFGSFATDELIARLITEGATRGMIFVAPVGNMAVQEHIAFPASHADVIAAGGMDEAGNLYPNKALASAAMVCAPYKNVFTTIPDNRHNFISGTSISSAVVSGILAVAAQRNQSLGIKDIPLFDGDICKWEEELINMPLCKKK